MLKKLFLSLGILLCISTAALANDYPIHIRVNNEYVYTDTKPFIYQGRTYVPIRFIGNALKVDSIAWDQTLQTAVVKGYGQEIRFPLGQHYAYVNGKKRNLSTPVMMANDRILIPVRFVAEIFGAEVNWNDQYQNVEIQKDGVTVPNNAIDTAFDHDELVWLSRIIHAESQGEPFEGQIAVGNVILNRVRSSQFPNTIYEVIFDRQHGVQFEPILNGSIYNNPLKKTIAAAKHALNGTNIAGEALYFYAPKTAQSSWIAKNRPYLMTIANHDFHL